MFMRRLRLNESHLRRLVGRLIVEALGQEHEFYHGTFQGYKDQFVQGIDTRRAKGYGQGSGFYVFFDKDTCVKHVRGYLVPKARAGAFNSNAVTTARKGELVPENNEGMIVVIREKLSLEDFDIDYEFLGYEFGDFVNDHYDEVAEMLETHGDKYMRRIPGLKFTEPPKSGSRATIRVPKGLEVEEDGSWFEKDSKDSSKFRQTTLSNWSKKDREQGLHIDYGYAGISTDDAAEFGWLGDMMKKYNPKLFAKFENQIFSSLGDLSPGKAAVKFNGDRIIYPVRMEDVDGNVLWRG